MTEYVEKIGEIMPRQFSREESDKREDNLEKIIIVDSRNYGWPHTKRLLLVCRQNG